MATVQMPEYQDNSEKAKREAEVKEREIKEPIKEGGAELRKRSAGKRFAETILPKEDRREIADYAIFEIVIPAIKETINNLVVNSLDMLLFGGERRYSGNRHSNGRTNYAGMSSKKSNKYSNDDYEERSRRRSAKSIDDILFGSYAKADKVYQALLDIQDEYGQVRVSDLFDEAEITVPDWTYDSYGWDNLPARADIETVRDRDETGRMVTKYALIMPRPYRISRR